MLIECRLHDICLQVNAMHHFGLGSAWRQQRDESEKPEGFKWMSISDSY